MDKGFNPPPEYVAQIERMAAAGYLWLAHHPNVCLDFAPQEPGVAYIGGLDAAIAWLGLNEPTRDLLRTMDEASGKQATIIQTQCALDLMFEPTRTSGGDN